MSAAPLTRRWLPVAVLVIVAALLIAFGRHHGLSDEAVGGLVGSLIGAAAILSGVLFDRQQRRTDDLESKMERRQKLKMLTAAELVNVAAGLIDAKEFLDSAIAEASKGTSVPAEDLLRHVPRSMPFSDSLGVALLDLSQREIGVLTTLRANLAITRASICREVENRNTLSWSTCKKIQKGMQHDMRLLAKAFVEFAPYRKLKVRDEEPEFASTLLVRLSGEPDG